MNGVKENERNEWMSGRQQQFKKLNLGSSGAAYINGFMQWNYKTNLMKCLKYNNKLLIWNVVNSAL